MKSLHSQKLLITLLFLTIISSCKKAGEEVIESVGKTITKETIETSAKAGTKAVIKSFTKKEIESVLLKEGFNTNILKNVLEKLSREEANLFINDREVLKSFVPKFNKNPDLVIAYKKLINSESHRTNINYLYQTENWIKKGSNEKLILEVPNNINKNLLGQSLNEVQFVKKIIFSKGINFSVIVPDFSKYKVFSNKIGSKFYTSADKFQFEICRMNLRKQYLDSAEKVEKLLIEQNKRFASNGGIVYKKRLITDPNEMLEIQKRDILQENPGSQQGRVFGFVWHHNENVGVIDLVAYDKHNSVKHIGGRNIWGGGSVARK